MSNDGANELRFSALEKQVSEQNAVIAELRAEHAANGEALAGVRQGLIVLQELVGGVEGRVGALEGRARVLGNAFLAFGGPWPGPLAC